QVLLEWGAGERDLYGAFVDSDPALLLGTDREPAFEAWLTAVGVGAIQESTGREQWPGCVGANTRFRYAVHWKASCPGCCERSPTPPARRCTPRSWPWWHWPPWSTAPHTWQPGEQTEATREHTFSHTVGPKVRRRSSAPRKKEALCAKNPVNIVGRIARPARPPGPSTISHEQTKDPCDRETHPHTCRTLRRSAARRPRSRRPLRDPFAPGLGVRRHPQRNDHGRGTSRAQSGPGDLRLHRPVAHIRVHAGDGGGHTRHRIPAATLP